LYSSYSKYFENNQKEIQRVSQEKKDYLLSTVTASEKKLFTLLKTLSDEGYFRFTQKKIIIESIASGVFHIVDFYIQKPHRVVIEIAGSGLSPSRVCGIRRCKVISLLSEEVKILSPDKLLSFINWVSTGGVYKVHTYEEFLCS